MGAAILGGSVIFGDLWDLLFRLLCNIFLRLRRIPQFLITRWTELFRAQILASSRLVVVLIQIAIT